VSLSSSVPEILPLEVNVTDDDLENSFIFDNKTQNYKLRALSNLCKYIVIESQFMYDIANKGFK